MEVREEYPDTVILFQIGGFYQMYYYDAILAEKVLEIKLLTRAMGKGKTAPMCGFPLSAMEKYVGQLTSKGYRVAVCNQNKSEDGDVIRGVSFIKEPTEDTEPMPYKAEWKEYMRNFSEDSIKQHSVLNSKSKAPEKEKVLADNLWEELDVLDVNNLSPMDAFHFIVHWKEKITKAKENVICE